MTDLAAFLAEACAALDRAVAARGVLAHHVTLATVSPEGWPEARTVVLRAADWDEATACIYSDIASGKVGSLMASPCAALHLWEPETALQVRLTCVAAIRSGDAVADLWADMGAAGRASYGKTPVPGTRIATAGAYREVSDPAAFVVLDFAIRAMDVVHLGPTHRRARFVPDGAATWLVP